MVFEIPTNPELHLQRRHQILCLPFPRGYCEENYEMIWSNCFEKVFLAALGMGTANIYSVKITVEK